MSGLLVFRLKNFLLIIPLFTNIIAQAQFISRNTQSSGCEEYLYISGASNVNQFSFKYNSEAAVARNRNAGKNSDHIEISIPIRDFEASNPMMYSDFLSLMKETEYPEIRITVSKQELRDAGMDPSGSCPDIRINIAGVVNIYRIPCSVVKCLDYLYFSGEKTIKLSDFHLKPPERLFGMVKVKNEINVNFGFIITFTENSPYSASR